MNIKKIKVDGFKNVHETVLELQEVTALVGLNNYGKSNLIEAIDFAQQFIKEPQKIKSRMMSREKYVPINKATSDRNFSFEMEYSTEVANQSWVVFYSFSFEWVKNENKGNQIVSEILKIKSNDSIENSKYSNYIKRTAEEAYYKSSPTGRCSTKVKAEPNELIINKLSNYDDLFYLEIIKELNNINFDLHSFYDTTNTSIGIPIERIEENLYSLTQYNGMNIAKLVYHLKEGYPDKYELLINSFKSLMPTIEKLEPICLDIKKEMEVRIDIAINNERPFKLSEKEYRIAVKETNNNQITSFDELSNGTKRIFLLLASAIVSDINKISLIMFEELENCIHPYLFQKLLILLSGIIENCKILITSHSPYLIQYLDLYKIYIGIPYENGIAHFSRIKKSMYKKVLDESRQNEISLGDYIFNLLMDSCFDNTELCSFMECA